MRYLGLTGLMQAVACLLALLSVPAEAQDPRASRVVLEYHGLQNLKADDSIRLESKALQVLRSSEFNSSEPRWAWDENAIRKEYSQALSGDHLEVTYSPAVDVNTEGGTITVSKLVIGLVREQYANSVHTVDGSGHVVGHAKYRGELCIQMLNLVKALPNTSLERSRDR